jgi:hypothetical protein
MSPLSASAEEDRGPLSLGDAFRRRREGGPSATYRSSC